MPRYRVSTKEGKSFQVVAADKWEAEAKVRKLGYKPTGSTPIGKLGYGRSSSPRSTGR
jgi:hypothetical protein